MLRRLGVETEPPRSPRCTNLSRRRASCSEGRENSQGQTTSSRTAVASAPPSPKMIGWRRDDSPAGEARHDPSTPLAAGSGRLGDHQPSIGYERSEIDRHRPPHASREGAPIDKPILGTRFDAGVPSASRDDEGVFRRARPTDDQLPLRQKLERLAPGTLPSTARACRQRGASADHHHVGGGGSRFDGRARWGTPASEPVPLRDPVIRLGFLPLPSRERRPAIVE
jgi:hypothetical protein